MKIMDLFQGKKNFQLTEDLCHEVANIINKGDGIESNYSRMTDGAGMRMYLVSPDGKTCWEMTTASGPLAITSTRLRNKGVGTYTAVMDLLVKKTRGTDTYVVIKEVHDPGTIAWCRAHGFVQNANNDDYVYVVDR